MIKIILNNKKEEVAKGTKVNQLLQDKNNPRAAVWINGKQLLKKEYPERVLEDGDEVKLLRIIAGG